jgi:putative transposase
MGSMLNQNELTAWYQQLELNQTARALIEQVRSSQPARRVGGGRSNVSGFYPSRKMGVTIQFESHRVELAAIYQMEHDPFTLEYYDQPPPIMLDYNSAQGRRMAVRHTPDFFVLRRDSAGWEEWKTEEDLHRLTQHNPNRYRQDGGCWRCPPGENYASQFGLTYRVRSSKEIQWRFQRNILFLQDYIRADSDTIPAATRDRILAYAHAVPALSLANLIQKTAEFATPDDIYLLIAAGRLYIDLYAEPLVEPATVRVFPNRNVAARYGVASDNRPPAHSFLPQGQSFRAGATLPWDSPSWQVADLESTKMALLAEDGDIVEVPQMAIESHVKEGRISQPPTVWERDGQKLSNELLRASEEDLRVANYRADIVRRHLAGEPAPDECVPARTLRRWTSRYRSAELRCGAGYIGLLPKTSRRGNSTRRLPDESLRLMNEVIEGEYENVKQKNRIACWAMLKESCKRQGVPVPSYTSFCLAVRNSTKFKQTLKRQGPRAAYQHGPFHMELDLKTPRHGDRPFEICHADHTQLDIELTDTAGTHNFGRPWMTLMIDAFSRRILAVHLDFEEPSYRSCMMVLRECVRRHNRLPQCLVVDWGPEFRSTYFEALLARYECTKKTRPPAKARFGSLVERAFSTTNTQFIYNLLGNTQITRNVRQVTKSVNPKELAVWPLGPFMERLSEYLFEIYDTNIHPALGESPRETYDRGFQHAGFRLHRLIAYDRDFMIATLPSTPKGTAMVSPGRGVKINYIFYWCDAMDDPKIEREQVPVRFDPFDLGTAYAFIGSQWLQCHSDHYRTFQGRSQKELLIASKQLRAQNRDRSPQFQITATKLAQAFQSIHLQESLLLERLRTRETQALRERTRPLDVDRDPDPALEPAAETVPSEFHDPIDRDKPQTFERF